jgi:uncharacterized protein (DUF2236 family)
VSWRVNAERVALAGWTRAILLQVAHPLIAAGVVRHSSFRDNPVSSARRLHHTVRAMLGLTFGDAATHARVIEDIRAIHRRVRGQLTEAVGLFPAGAVYSAEDPALVLWVHATLIESVILAYDALVAPIGLTERDAYCREAAGVAIELGARPPDVPLDWRTLERYLSAQRESGAIVVGPDARAVATVLLQGRFSTVLGPIARANRILTAGWLPPDLREQYGLSWSDEHDRKFQRTVRRLRRLRRVLPDAMALWPEASREVGRQK